MPNPLDYAKNNMDYFRMSDEVRRKHDPRHTELRADNLGADHFDEKWPAPEQKQAERRDTALSF